MNTTTRTSKRGLRPFAIMVFASCALGCGDAGDDSREGLLVARWTVSSSPRIIAAPSRGGFTDDWELPAAGLILETGLAIADGFARRIVLIDSSGVPSAIVGREGDGPGEFRAISWLGECGVDSVFAWDFMLQRMTVVTRGGEIVRQFKLPDNTTHSPPPAVLTCSADGRIAYVARPDLVAQATAADITHVKGGLFLADRVGQAVRIRDSIPLAEFVSSISQYRPLGKQTTVAVWKDVIYIGTGDSALVVGYDLSGNQIARVDLWLAPRTPTATHKSAAAVAQTQWVAEEAIRSRMRARLERYPAPATLPQYTSVSVDDLGRIWAVLSAPGDSVTLIRGASPDGRLIADIVVPRYVNVLDIRRGHVLAAATDEAGHHEVLMYQFEDR